MCSYPCNAEKFELVCGSRLTGSTSWAATSVPPRLGVPAAQAGAGRHPRPSVSRAANPPSASPPPRNVRRLTRSRASLSDRAMHPPPRVQFPLIPRAPPIPLWPAPPGRLRVSQPGVEKVAEPVAEQVEAQDAQDDRRARKDADPRGLAQVHLALADDAAPRRDLRRDSDPKEAQRGFPEHGIRGDERRLHDHGRRAVDEDVARQDARRA